MGRRRGRSASLGVWSPAGVEGLEAATEFRQTVAGFQPAVCNFSFCLQHPAWVGRCRGVSEGLLHLARQTKDLRLKGRACGSALVRGGWVHALDEGTGGHCKSNGRARKK